MNGVGLTHEQQLQCVEYLRALKHPDGGFCGGVGLLPHLISTFAAVMAIVSIGTEEAYELIDVPKMRDFLLSLKNNGEEK